MSIEVTVIGSGDTLGTPVAGDTFPACLDKESKRYRFGLLLNIDGVKILVDANPDLKWQCLDNNFMLKEIDYILLTHTHSDHINGMGEFYYRRITPTEVFFFNHPLTHAHIEHFRYLEGEEVLSFTPVDPYVSFSLKSDITVTPITMNHGFPTIGYTISVGAKKIAIVTDSNSALPEKTLNQLSNVDALFIDAFSENLDQVRLVYETCNIEIPEKLEASWFHMTFEEAKHIGKQIDAKMIIPIHISRYVAPHAELVKKHQTTSFIVPKDGYKICI